MRTYKIMGTNNSYTNFDFMKYMTFLREHDYEAEAKAFELLHQYHHDSVRDLAWQFMYNGELPSMEDSDELKSYWAYDAADAKWYLWRETDDGENKIAEVGQDEDGTYYWVECENSTGYCDFATAEKAMADADNYIL